MPSEQPPERQRVRPITERGARRGHGAVFYGLVFLTAILVLNMVFGEKGVLAMIRARKEYNTLSAEVERIKARNAELTEQMRRLKEDPVTIEDLARRELGFIRPGEKLFIISDVPPASPPPVSHPSPAPPPPPKRHR
jgi:cell division protein FtsB